MAMGKDKNDGNLEHLQTNVLKSLSKKCDELSSLLQFKEGNHE